MRPIYHPIQFEAIEQVNPPDGARYYKTPTGDYPSITRVLGTMVDHSWVDEWRAKVGDKFADEYTRQAADRGSMVHDGLEHYLKGTDPVFAMGCEIEKKIYNDIKSEFISRVDITLGSEIQLYSPKLKIAGTCDFLGIVDNVLCVADWKTSNQYKYSSGVLSYHLQVTAYCAMIYDLLRIQIKRGYIVIGMDEFTPLIYEVEPLKHMPQLIEMVNKYHSVN